MTDQTRRNALATIFGGAAALPAVASAAAPPNQCGSLGPNDRELWRLAAEHERLADEGDRWMLLEEDAESRDQWRYHAVQARDYDLQARGVQRRAAAIPPDSAAGVGALAAMIRRANVMIAGSPPDWSGLDEGACDRCIVVALVEGAMAHCGGAA